MTRIFGPQPQTYTGPYPTEAEALAVANNAPPVPTAEVVADAINLGGRIVRLDTGVGAGLCRASRACFDPATGTFFPEVGPVRAAVWKNACIIIRIPTGFLPDPQTPVQPACVAVCDLRTGRPFAYYAEGDYYHRFPPVPWLP